MIFPRSLGPGSVVRVIAPSGPFEPALVWRALGWLAERYRVRFDRAMFQAAGYLAGDDERRAGELADALVEPEVAAILCARGGYGSGRFAHRLDWRALAASPRWLCGFSDVTALHVEAERAGVASLHGPNATGLGCGDALARERFVAALERPLARRRWSLAPIVAGEVTGPLYGGNLTLLHACAAAGRLGVPAGAILLLEDVAEAPYRLDRMLTSLCAGGWLDRVGGVVVGELTDCQPGRDGVTAITAVSERLRALGRPAAFGAPFGHGARNEPFVLGAPARLSVGSDGATLAWGNA